ncbi:hypothetical protein FRB94_008732 [Tulasnella sp. JGI-2019a]|nr:hypothetical protein FRB94_008732 [Tulasnella sp. JGI-2019a]
MATTGRLVRISNFLSMATRPSAYQSIHRPVPLRSIIPGLVRPKFAAFSTSCTRRSASAVQTSDEPRKALICTCNAQGCGHRGKYEFTQHAYERGVVIIQCPKCKTRHLIADHIGWFKETDGTDGGQLKNVEDFMRAKGEHVSKGVQLDDEGTIEYIAKE